MILSGPVFYHGKHLLKLQSIIFPLLFIISTALLLLLFPELKTALYRSAEIDSYGHLFSFFCMAWVFHSVLGLNLTTTSLGLIFYGGLTEIGQYYLGFRNGEWSDFVANTLGILLFTIMATVYHKVVHYKQR